MYHELTTMNSAPFVVCFLNHEMIKYFKYIYFILLMDVFLYQNACICIIFKIYNKVF